MVNRKKLSLFALITLLTLLANLVFPVSVLADDETPPLAPTEEISPTAETTPTDLSETETAPQESTGEPDPVSEALEQLPENTELIVLDESGEPLPLVTEEAEEAIIVGDPVWCPSTLSAPTPGTNGCTTSYVSFQDLIDYLDANEQAMDGTIWIESSYNSSVNDPTSSGFVFDSGAFTTMSNYALTIQGGWNGVSGSSTIGSASVFSGDYLVITNWIGNVTINDIAIDGTSGSDGITVITNGAVNLSDVSVQNSDYSGVYIVNQGSTANVSINNSQFSDNDDSGLEVYSSGNITLNNVIANDNGEDGAYLENCGCSGNVFITNSQFNNNDEDGLDVSSAGNVTLDNVIANDNKFDGTYIDNSLGTGNISIIKSQFNNNEGGLEVYSAGNITLNSVIANSNLDVGANLFNCGCGGAIGINVFGSTFNNNGYSGLEFLTDGSVNIENTTANNNGVGGIGGDALGNITIINTVVNGNPHGLGFSTFGDVNIKCSIVKNNSIDGVYVIANNLNLVGSTITNNGVDYENAFGAVNIFDYNCNPSGKKPVNSGLPLNIVQGGNADLDCDNFSGTVLILPNGDKVTFKCPIGDSATLNRLAQENGLPLPKELPESVEYVSGLVSTTSPDGSDVALDGLVVTSFIIPDGMQGEDFAILYWNGTEWVDLDTATFTDGRNVSNGGYVTKDGYFEAFTNFTGNFVLVKK